MARDDGQRNANHARTEANKRRRAETRDAKIERGKKRKIERKRLGLYTGR